jgi:hypothetical protein
MKKYIQGFFEQIVRPQYQVIAFLITLTIVIVLGMRAVARFNPLEQYPELQSITPEKIKEWGGEPVIVNVGLYITNWHQFDLVKNIFVFDGVVWFEFDPSLIALDTIEKFSFQKGEILQKSEPSTKLIGGKLFAEYKIRLRFTTTLSHQFFPLDDHRIYITLINTYVTPSEVILRSYKSDFTSSPKIIIPEWRQVDHAVRTGYEEDIIDKFDERKIIRYPSVEFMIDFSRIGIRLTLLIFLPVFLIFFVSTFWLSFDPKSTAPILALVTGAVTSLIAYRFVIQGMSPEVGYFLLSDHIFTFFLALSCVSFVLALLWINLRKKTTTMIIVRGVLFILFHILFIAFWYYLLFMWA